MSERIPFSSADDRLKNWEASQAAHEAAQYEEEMYGEAGKTNFSETARQRLNEASEYEKHLQSMQERGDEYDAFEATLDAAEGGEHLDAIDRTIVADKSLRRMQRMASEVADLYATEVTADNEKTLSRRLKDKEDKLEELLVKFNDESTLSTSEKDDIIRRIIDSSDRSEPTLAPEAGAEATTDADDLVEKEDAASTADTAESGTDASDKPEKAAETPIEPYDVEADIEATKQQLKDAADKKAEDAIDQIKNSEQAKADRELLEHVSEEGLEDEDGELEPVSEEGLEDQPDEDVETETDEEQSTEQRKKGAVRKFFSTISKAFDKAAVGTGYALTAASQKLIKRGGQKSGETDEEFEARKRKYGRAAIIGTVAVAGAVLASRLAGAEAGGGSAHAAEVGNSDALDSLLGGPLDTDTGGADTIEYSKDALRVDNGEGLLQTFKEMGIPAKDRQELLNEVGPKLVRMGEAYRDPSIGGYGLNGDGRISRRALDVISEAAKNLK